MNNKRCFGNGLGKEFYARYHDEEWGIPVHDDTTLFELLILEGAQAGLSWETILKKREGYRKTFYSFEPRAVAAMSDEELEKVLESNTVIRHRGKVFSARQNARIFLEIQGEFGSFNQYVWGFVQGSSKVNHWKSLKEVPVETEESQLLSKNLKKRGMNFVGPKIIYAYMQAIGMVNDHLIDCPSRFP